MTHDFRGLAAIRQAPWPLFMLMALGAFSGAARAADRARKIEYNRDIRPILSDRCFRCHGPDSATRQAGMRLDRREDAVIEHGGCRPIVPHKPDESEVYRRVTTDDADARMPPVDTGQTLTEREQQLLREWILAGAEYQPHWSFISPQRAKLPGGVASGSSAIDHFIRAELSQQGLKPSAEADRATLLRRVSFDLTGLPPTPEESDAFLADESTGAYERAVDRLLASPRFGERMALDWLDAARYADSNGYYLDMERRVWPWREWVIQSFNRNLPFDQFTVEQLAGDLLPNPTTEQKIATGFNRQNMTNGESGIIDEEYRVSYVVDRIDTTSTVWLGLSTGCARCHDHKYDPISQREYYGLFAFFNNSPEKGLVKDAINPPPTLLLPTVAQERELADVQSRRAACQEQLKAAAPELDRAIAAWESGALAELPPMPTTGLLVDFPLDGEAKNSGPADARPVAIGAMTYAPGVVGSAAEFDATQYVEFAGTPQLERDRPFTLAIWIKPAGTPTGCVISKMASTVDARGFEIIWFKSRPRINLVHQWGRDSIEIEAKQTFPSKQWRHLAVAYDGSGRAAGMKLYVDGALQEATVRRDKLTGSAHTPEPWRIAWKGMGVGFEGGIDQLRIYERPLAADEIAAMFRRDMLGGVIPVAEKDRTKQQREQLRSYYVERHASDELRETTAELARLTAEEEAVRQQVVSSPVMEDMTSPRDTRLLKRGEYDQLGDAVAAGVPAALGKWPANEPANRLGLARWIVNPRNPLTARVIVNRYWQLMFGEGLVRTANDFGLQGELPSHPELLDWLAVDFMQSGWDVKWLLKQFVVSETYRQSSRFTPELLRADPENRLLGRGPRYRLPPEMIRDQALYASGLMVERIGGPSVKPYQPVGIWEAVSYNGEQSYEVGAGDDLYRRSLYTYWKRQAPPPGMLAFDAPTRETCTVRRPRTNTPLQALVLLNDITYVEAARQLGTRALRADGDDAVRLGAMFRRVTGRVAKNEELAALSRHLTRERERYRDDADAASALLRVGESNVDESLDPRELAAWTMTASLLLNLDETVTQH